jgi:protocatechuate 3,4-dioxygenase alpha subunit
MCRRPDNELVSDAQTETVEIVGALYDGAGEPIPDGVIELWSATSRSWGRCGTQPDGTFRFLVSKPPGTDNSAPHFEVYVFARGLLRHQLTRLYFPNEKANAQDPVLASLPRDERETLVARHDGTALRFDVHMQGERQTVFFET